MNKLYLPYYRLSDNTFYLNKEVTTISILIYQHMDFFLIFFLYIPAV